MGSEEEKAVRYQPCTQRAITALRGQLQLNNVSGVFALPSTIISISVKKKTAYGSEHFVKHVGTSVKKHIQSFSYSLLQVPVKDGFQTNS